MVTRKLPSLTRLQNTANHLLGCIKHGIDSFRYVTGIETWFLRGMSTLLETHLDIF